MNGQKALALSLALLVLVLSNAAFARSYDGYDLSWSTIDGGGYTFSTGGDFTLGGTMGQPDAGLLAGGPYTLGGGFWCGGALQFRIYLPLLLKNY